MCARLCACARLDAKPKGMNGEREWREERDLLATDCTRGFFSGARLRVRGGREGTRLCRQGSIHPGQLGQGVAAIALRA